MRPVKKDYEDIALEWDKIAVLRNNQIGSGLDISFLNVLLPCILNLSNSSDFRYVLDAGCGTGYVTYQIAKKAKKVVGVDISKENITIAKEKCSVFVNTTFINSSIEDFAKNYKHNCFSLCVANMTLMNVTSLEKVVGGIADLLKHNADFIFTITHPCYWPLYWGYIYADWFSYKEEISIEAPFKITLDNEKEYVTTHIHRPLEMYVSILQKYNFRLEKFVEPIPLLDEQVDLNYKKSWKYPRFIGIKATLKKGWNHYRNVVKTVKFGLYFKLRIIHIPGNIIIFAIVEINEIV